MDKLNIKWNHLRQALEDFADYFIQSARDNLQENKSNASYDLFDSFEKIVEIGDDSYSVKIQLEDYWYYVENGRGPGKFPPLPKIQEWIEIKPIEPYPDENGRTPTVQQLSFLIGRKISEEGTDPQPFFEPAKKEAINKFKLTIDLAITEDIDEYINEITEEYMNRIFRQL